MISQLRRHNTYGLDELERVLTIVLRFVEHVAVDQKIDDYYS